MATVGSGDFVYEPAVDWFHLPPDVLLTEAVGVAVDSADNLYVFNRADPPIIVFDPAGHYLRHWGAGHFVRPHGIWIDEDDTLYLTDDVGHSMRQFTPNGELICTFGPVNQPSPTNAVGFDYRKITHGDAPYNLPTNTVKAPNGDVYVADGYGNARIHRFAPTGEYKTSWGEPGSGPGQFNLPHGLGFDRAGRLYVGDRENSRIQIFSLEGEFIEEWTDVVRPCQVFVAQDGFVYVGELGRKAGMFDWLERDSKAPGARVSIFDQAGQLQARWGGGTHPESLEDLYTGHDVCVDSQGNVYVGEVSLSAAKAAGVNPETIPTLRKFVRV